MARRNEICACGRRRLVDVADRTRTAQGENRNDVFFVRVFFEPETLFSLTLTWHEDFLVEVHQKQLICHMTDVRLWRGEG